MRQICIQTLKLPGRGILFPKREELRKMHHFTLLNGKMIITQKQERRYLVYDMMAINQVSLVERPFYERWRMIEKEVMVLLNFVRQHIQRTNQSQSVLQI